MELYLARMLAIDACSQHLPLIGLFLLKTSPIAVV